MHKILKIILFEEHFPIFSYRGHLGNLKKKRNIIFYVRKLEDFFLPQEFVQENLQAFLSF